MPETVDLRSDTVTRPTAAMRQAMARAEVGDDVLGDDPTLLALEERVASLTGKEAALYTVSGTLGNQLAIRALTRHGDEVLLDRESHIFRYESAAAAALSGVQLHPLDGERGEVTADAVRASFRPEDDHNPPVTLLCLENTHNRAGGRVLPLDRLEAAAGAAREGGAAVHLDGARLWNAVAASGVPLERWAALADTVMLSFSKGLGAPVGSILAGSREVVRRARRLRKMFGGGIRQGGILAAACLHALDAHRERLGEDHARARRFAEAVHELPGVSADPARVETNLVLVEVVERDSARLAGDGGRTARVHHGFEERGVLLQRFGPTTLRAAFHLDVDDAGVARAIAAAREVLAT